LPDADRFVVVVFFGIHLQAPLGVGLLFFREPFGVLGEVRDDEDAGDSEEAGDGAVDDEEPAVDELVALRPCSD
jgi:hypothetical protein